MTDRSVMRASTDEHVPDEAAVLPFEPLVPNVETITAMRESRSGRLPRFESVDALVTDLNADD